MTKKDKTFDIQKWEIFLTNFEKSTLIGAIIVTLTGLIVYGHIRRGIFGSFSYLLLMSMHKVFQEYSSTCVVYLGKQGKEITLKEKFLLTLEPCGRLHPV